MTKAFSINNIINLHTKYSKFMFFFLSKATRVDFMTDVSFY